MPGLLGTHHVGIVVKDVAVATSIYEKTFGYRVEGGVVEDPIQRVRIQFLLGRAGEGRIELLEPVGEGSPVAKALKRGGGLHHICYCVDDIVAAIAAMRGERVMLVSGPVPAVAISNAPVAFLFSEALGLFELVEAPGRVTGAA